MAGARFAIFIDLFVSELTQENTAAVDTADNRWQFLYGLVIIFQDITPCAGFHS